MAGWMDWLFGSSTPMPARPTSIGALLGAGYQGLPSSSRIDDRRRDAPDYHYWMQQRSEDPPNKPYLPEGYEWDRRPGYDNFPMAAATVSMDTPEDVAPYKSSFQPGFKPHHATIPLSSEMGPNLPPGGVDYTSSRYSLPYMPPHLPISPGERGWTPPPSPSGPHNLQGDPPRPGYDRPSFDPRGFSPLNPDDAFRFWRGGYD